MKDFTLLLPILSENICIYVQCGLLEFISGLTLAALVGVRKQSVADVEQLLSYRMATFIERRGYEGEQEYTSHITFWHEALDGRGLSQLQLSQGNYEMQNYILKNGCHAHHEL